MTIPNLAPAILVTDSRTQLAQLRKSTDALQTTFVKSLVTEMRKSMNDEFKDVPGADVYEGMVNDVLANDLSSTGHFGLSDQMFQQMAPTVMHQAAMTPAVAEKTLSKLDNP